MGEAFSDLLEALPEMDGWITSAIVALVAFGALLTKLEPVTSLLARVFQPILRPDVRRVRRLESVLASTIAQRMDRLDDKGTFLPSRYTELSAAHVIEEVRLLERWRKVPRPGSGRRRLVPISRTLRHSRYRIMHLEGAPGSGKSVALRHLARTMAVKASRMHLRTQTLPIYVNLRDCPPEESGNFTASTLRHLAQRSINPAGSATLDQYIKDHFEDRLLRGRWLFLIDSFDELPSILAASDADPIVEEVTEQVREFFLSGDNTCRGIIASRPYRGPKEVTWHRLTIAPLSARQRAQIVRTTVHPDYEPQLIQGIASATLDLLDSTTNPLFLALLCDFVNRNRGRLPLSRHEIFEDFVAARVKRDQERREAVGADLSASQISNVASLVAFRMTSTGETTVPQAVVHDCIMSGGYSTTRSRDVFDLLLSLGLLTTAELGGVQFPHRLLRDYFATTMIIRKPELVGPAQLLLDRQWRDVTVTLLQTQPPERLSAILGEAERLFVSMAREPPYAAIVLASEPARIDATQAAVVRAFEWNPDVLHLLQILSAGLRARPHLLSDRLRLAIGNLLVVAAGSGLSHHFWLALDVATLSPTAIAEALVQAGLRSTAWVRNAALAKASQLSTQSDSVTQSVIVEVARRVAFGEAFRHRALLLAELRRFPQPAPLVRAMRFLLAAPALQLAADALPIIVYGTPPASGFAALNMAAFLGVVWLLAIGTIKRIVEKRTAATSWTEAMDFLLRYVGAWLLFFTGFVLVGATVRESVPLAVAYLVVEVYAGGAVLVGTARIRAEEEAPFLLLPVTVFRYLAREREVRSWITIPLGILALGAIALLVGAQFNRSAAERVLELWLSYSWIGLIVFVAILAGSVVWTWRRERRELRWVKPLITGPKTEVGAGELAGALLGSQAVPASVAPGIPMLRASDRGLSGDAIEFLDHIGRARVIERQEDEWIISTLSSGRFDVLGGPFVHHGFRSWAADMLSQNRQWLLDLGWAFDDELGRLLVDTRYRSG